MFVTADLALQSGGGRHTTNVGPISLPFYTPYHAFRDSKESIFAKLRSEQGIRNIRSQMFVLSPVHQSCQICS